MTEGETIDLVFTALGDEVSLKGKQGWLAEPNPFLDGQRPIDELRLGRLDKVLAAIESYQNGDFA